MNRATTCKRTCLDERVTSLPHLKSVKCLERWVTLLWVTLCDRIKPVLHSNAAAKGRVWTKGWLHYLTWSQSSVWRGEWIFSESFCAIISNQSFIPVQLLAVWVLSDWMNSGQPSNCQLVELGPGRGTLLKDMLRVRVHKYYVWQALFLGFSQFLHLFFLHKELRGGWVQG